MREQETGTNASRTGAERKNRAAAVAQACQGKEKNMQNNTIQELEIKVDQTPPQIIFNYEEVRDALEERMQIYREIEVTETNLPERRRDIATLRKIAKAVEDRRREVRTAYLAPYQDFEAKTKELIAIIQQPVDLLSRQVQRYEERQREAKQKQIQEYFTKAAAGTHLRFDAVFRKEWRNASVSMKSICAEINDRIRSYQADLDALRAFGSEAEEDALAMYHRTGQLSDAIRIINEYEAQKRRILEAEERRHREAEARAARETAERERQEEIRRAEQAAREREELECRIRAEERARIEEHAREEHAGAEECVCPGERTGAGQRARTEEHTDTPEQGQNIPLSGTETRALKGQDIPEEGIAFPGSETNAAAGSIAFPAADFSDTAETGSAEEITAEELEFPAGPDRTVGRQIAYLITAAPGQHRALEAYLTAQRIRYRKEETN